MDSTGSTPDEPPTDSTVGESIERLNQLTSLARTSIPATANSDSHHIMAAVQLVAREFFSEVSRLEPRTLSTRELLLLLQALGNLGRYLHLLSLQFSEELFHRICTKDLNQDSLGPAMHLLADTLQLGVAETGFLTKLAGASGAESATGAAGTPAAPTARGPTLRPRAP